MSKINLVFGSCARFDKKTIFDCLNNDSNLKQVISIGRRQNFRYVTFETVEIRLLNRITRFA